LTYFTDQDQGQNPVEDFLTKVVETKGEQWRDPAILAKGYLSSQEYIATLQREKEELLEDLKKQTYSKDLLEHLKTPPKRTEAEQPPNTTVATSEQDLRAMIKETLTQNEREATSKQNLQVVDHRLTELFGTETAATVEARRKELGVTKERLTEIASESPTAFLKLMGEAPTKEDNRTFKGSLNTASGFLTEPSSTRNFQFYQDLRRKSPSQYHSGATRALMEKDRTALGEKFYN